MPFRNFLARIVRRTTSAPGIRAGQVFSLAAMLIVIGFSTVLAVWAAARPAFGALAALLLFGGILGAGLILAEGLRLLFLLFGQWRRDLAAAQIHDALLAGETPTAPFVLYLRPFSSTNALARTTDTVVPIPQAELPGGPKVFAIGTDRIEFEATIEASVRKTGTMIGLGRPLEHIGAGRIPVDDETWQDTVARLMEHAKLIVLLPSPAGGTRWEVDRLLSSDLMTKTVIVDPPNLASEREDYDPAVEWAAMREVFRDKGYALPDDDRAGQLVYFGDQTEPHSTCRLAFDEVSAIRKFLEPVVVKSH
ncbi:MAG: hypothetical protein AAFQ84_02820 [Pseudomonadota bacterium]